MIYLLVVGLVSILGQAVLLRELNVAFYGIELIYVLAFGMWLIWTALGAWSGRKNADPSRAGIQWLLILYAVLLPADLIFIRSIRILFSDVPGAYLTFPSQMASMAAALFPIGFLSGLIFQWSARHRISRGSTFADAYATESAGGLAGGICATLFLKFGMQNLTIALLCALFAVSAVFAGSEAGSRLRRVVGACVVAILLLLVWRAGSVDPAMTAWSHPGLLDSLDTPYSRITVTQEKGRIAVYENDALSWETEGTRAEEFVHVAALQLAHPRRVLILGGGVEGTVGEVMKHLPERVDYVEFNPALLKLVVPRLPAELRSSLEAAQVHITVADARRFLDGPDLFDLILIGMPEPASGQANRFYTYEFFAQCAAHLKPEGILSFRLQSAENLWTAQQTGRAVSIYRALKASLPEVQVLPGGANVFLASRQPLAHDPALLASRLESRAVATRLVSAPYLRYLYGNDRFSQIATALAAGSAPLNTDVRPICYQYTLMIWLSKFYPGLAAADMSVLESWRGAQGLWIWGLLALLALVFRFRAKRPSMRRSLLVGAAAFAGMVLETAIVLYYQVKSGILYQDIGLLLTGFMAGLALGAYLTGRWIRHGARRVSLWHGCLLCMGFALFSMAAYRGMESEWIAGLAQSTLALLIAGFLVAAALAYAAGDGSGDQGTLVAPLYAADLIGGCAGSMIASLLLIPGAGLAITALSMAPWAMLMMILI